MLNDDEQGSSSGSLFAPSRQLTIVVPLLWALCGPEREWRVLPRCVEAGGDKKCLNDKFNNA